MALFDKLNWFEQPKFYCLLNSVGFILASVLLFGYGYFNTDKLALGVSITLSACGIYWVFIAYREYSKENQEDEEQGKSRESLTQLRAEAMRQG